jgi:hypothetical protein
VQSSSAPLRSANAIPPRVRVARPGEAVALSLGPRSRLTPNHARFGPAKPLGGIHWLRSCATVRGTGAEPHTSKQTSRSAPAAWCRLPFVFRRKTKPAAGSPERSGAGSQGRRACLRGGVGRSAREDQFPKRETPDAERRGSRMHTSKLGNQQYKYLF